jgi:Flp pilus assembly protein TadG
MKRAHASQRGQAIVLVVLLLTVLFGFIGLAIDGGRSYLDRRHIQGSVDAAALAAAYDYMNHSDYSQAELAAVNQFANNERLYAAPVCSGYGTLSVSCNFSDPANAALTLDVANHSIAGVTFKATASHQVGVTMMQVLGFGPTVTVGATATAVARRAGTNGAAIQTLSPGNCNGTANSLTFTGTSTTSVTGDVWSNGSITDNGSAGGSIDGNVINVCPNVPPTSLPNFTVSGAQANGFNIPDPGFAQQTLNTSSRTWASTSGSSELAGTYAADPHLVNSSGCYFLAGGIYTWSTGFTDNGGFVSNLLRPPDEANMVSAGTPNLTTLSADLTGTRQTSISVNALPGAVPAGSQVVAWGGGTEQTFTVAAAAAAGATSLSINRQDVTGTIPAGTLLSIRAFPQFWDSNGVNCSGTFSLTTAGSGSLTGGTYSVKVTAVRWQPNGVTSCSGPISPTCYLRESAPSMCKTISVGNSGIIKVQITNPVPGATDYNVYVAANGGCSGLTFCTDTGNGLNNTTISNPCPPGGALPPDEEGMPLGAGLPNADPAPGTPPRGDMANAGHCVNLTTGVAVACPSAWTVGAVQFYIPGGGNASTCLNLEGGGDMYVYSGYQYQRILLYEPGPEQQPPANTCLNNVAGHGLTSLIGIFYVPAASVTIIGSSSFLATIAGGVIAWNATIKGNGGVSIIADPTLRTWPSAVRLTQ